MDASFGLELNKIADRYYINDETRKPIIYLAEYEKLFREVRYEKLHILELGVHSGASLLMWRDYLPNAIIVGLDIGDKPACINNDNRIRFVKGSQDDPLALEKAAQASGGQFDFIIDDASHIGYHTKRAFCYLFPYWLKAGGYYIIEDFGTGYYPILPYGSVYVEPSFDDKGPHTRIFKSHQYGVVGFLKQLVDYMMKDLMTKSPSYLNIVRITFIINCAIIRKSENSTIEPPYPVSLKPSKGSFVLNSLIFLRNRIFNMFYRLRNLRGMR